MAPAPDPSAARARTGPDRWAWEWWRSTWGHWTWWQWAAWVLWAGGSSLVAAVACVLVLLGASTTCSEDPSLRNLQEGQHGLLLVLAASTAATLWVPLVGRRHPGRWCTAIGFTLGPSMVCLVLLRRVEDFRGTFCLF